MKVKICGLIDPENVQKISVLEPDYLGFVLDRRSPRFVAQPERLTKLVSRKIRTVGVFVNSTIADVAEITYRSAFDALQFHGHEDPKYIEKIRLKFPGIRIFKTIFSQTGEKIKYDRDLETLVDFFILEQRRVPGELSSNYKANHWPYDVPYFRAGGISAAWLRSEPFDLKCSKCIGIDVSSNLEIKPGYKCPKLAKEIICIARDDLSMGMNRGSLNSAQK